LTPRSRRSRASMPATASSSLSWSDGLRRIRAERY
jgi:hypothetical protein